MKKEKNSGLAYSGFEPAKSTVSFLRTLTVFLIICLIAVTVMIALINRLIKQHDKELTTEICSLVSEKVNNSIDHLTGSVENLSSVLSAQNAGDLQQLYDELKRTKSEKFISLGLVDCDNNIYATDTEIEEFEKWHLLEISKFADPVSISSPYRSGLNGQPVFTMFSKLTYGGGKSGRLFVTYPLSEIQSIAYTASLDNKVEIWLMNAASNNIIQCAGVNKYSLGSWASALIQMKEINEEDKPDYFSWKEKMNNGEDNASLVYHIDKELYTQVFSSIKIMKGWYIVVRLPSSSLSDTMVKFRYTVMGFSGVLFLATVVLLIIYHRRETKEKLLLENLSILDPLTSVMNRRAFDISAEELLGKKSKNGAALIFLDIDYFKQVNDQYGHETGDKVLREFSAALNDLFSDIGIVSRYGGDEFVVLLDTASRDIINEKLEQLTVRTKAINIFDEDDPRTGSFRVSFSAGAAQYPRNARDLKGLMACSDDALYIVKQKGRNGYGWYTDSKDKDYSYEGIKAAEDAARAQKKNIGSKHSRSKKQSSKKKK